MYVFNSGDILFFSLKNIINPWNLIKSMHIFFLDIHVLIRRVRKKIWFVMPAMCSIKISILVQVQPKSGQILSVEISYQIFFCHIWNLWVVDLSDFSWHFPFFFYFIGCVCDVKETTDGYYWEADQSLWGFEGVSALGVNYRWCFKVIFVKIYLYYLYSYIFLMQHLYAVKVYGHCVESFLKWN